MCDKIYDKQKKTVCKNHINFLRKLALKSFASMTNRFHTYTKTINTQRPKALCDNIFFFFIKIVFEYANGIG